MIFILLSNGVIGNTTKSNSSISCLNFLHSLYCIIGIHGGRHATSLCDMCVVGVGSSKVQVGGNVAMLFLKVEYLELIKALYLSVL